MDGDRCLGGNHIGPGSHPISRYAGRSSGQRRSQRQGVLAGISVADAKASAKWYQQKLHFYIYKTMDLPEHHLKIVFLDLNGFSLELIQFAGAMSFEVVKKRVPELTDRDRLLGFVKLGFQIAEVDALAAELKRDGTKLLMEPTEDREFHDRFLMLQDPDGNVLQFFQKLK